MVQSIQCISGGSFHCQSSFAYHFNIDTPPLPPCIIMLFVLIAVMLGFSFIQYTNTWLSHEAFFIIRDIDITTSTGDRLRNLMGSRNKEQAGGQCVRSSDEGKGGGGVKGRGGGGIVTTEHAEVSLEAAVRLFMCWGGSFWCQTVGQ